MEINPVLKKLGERIRYLRKSSGISQEDFAGKVGLDRGYFGKVERGEVNISILKLSYIAKHLNVTISDLF